MPSPKGTGAPLAPINIVAPGRFGLNTQSAANILGPEWATEASNAVFDLTGRLTARKGWAPATGTAMTGTPVVDVIHEYIREDGSSSIISSGGNKIWSGTSSHSDVTGTSTITVGDNWQFLNFIDECIGVQQGEQPIRSTGGNFADLVETSGDCPTGNCGLAAFGRLWIAGSDKQTIKYSALLSSTLWDTPDGAGSIDMTSVWPNGMDEVVALAAYNGTLVIFGKNCVVFYTDGQGSALGIDPDNMYVSDTIIGTGCIARDSVQQIDNGDMLFLSANGVQSLQRLIQERSNPIMNVSMNVRDYLLDFVSSETMSEIRSIYAPKEGFYLLVFPTASKVFCFDTRFKLEDGTYRITEWSSTIKAGVRANDNTVYLSLSNLGGRLGTYSGYNDRNSSNSATTYTFQYLSGWLDLGADFAGYIKMLKSINGIVFSGTSTNTMSVTWDFDFQGTPDSYTVLLDDTGSPAEYGLAEFGVAEYSGGGALTRFRVPASGAGQYTRVGLTASISANTFSIQQINLYAKVGRLAN
jgi:hypothetical protein